MATKPPDLRRYVDSKLSGLPRKVEERAVIVLSRLFSRLTREAFERGEDVYGRPRKAGVDGDKLDLVQTGLTRGTIGYSPDGRRVRFTANSRYVPYLISKFGLAPNGRGRLPESWIAEANRALRFVLSDIVR